jgi:hypothetical protein
MVRLTPKYLCHRLRLPYCIRVYHYLAACRLPRLLDARLDEYNHARVLLLLVRAFNHGPPYPVRHVAPAGASVMYVYLVPRVMDALAELLVPSPWSSAGALHFSRPLIGRAVDPPPACSRRPLDGVRARNQPPCIYRCSSTLSSVMHAPVLTRPVPLAPRSCLCLACMIIHNIH